MSVEKKETPTKRVYKPIFVGSVDTTQEDVLRYSKEGRKMHFLDDEDTFLELSPEAAKSLSLDNRTRYDVAKNIINGVDVTGAMTDAINGYKSDYNVRPGSSSANLQVFGKKAGEDYYWERPENIDKRRHEGWQVNHDKDVHTVHNESCSHSTVGGEKSPEMILISRPLSASKQMDAKNTEKRNRLVGRAKDSFREGVERLGAVATVD